MNLAVTWPWPRLSRYSVHGLSSFTLWPILPYSRSLAGPNRQNCRVRRNDGAPLRWGPREPP